MPNITRTLSPAGAISNGAAWCVVESSGTSSMKWQASGATVVVSAGTYTIRYRYAEMYSTPADETVVITSSNNSATGTYGSVAWKSTWQPPISMCLFRGQVFTVGEKRTTPDSGISAARLVRWSEIGAFRFLGCTANALKNTAGEFYLGESDAEMGMRVLPLSNCVMVYGSFSTWALVPVSQPAPGYSPQFVMNTGIKQPLAVGGHDKAHLLVDKMGFLYLITPDGGTVKHTNLGFQRIFSDMQNSLSLATGIGVISVVYNPDEDEFYIGNGASSYLFKDGVLTQLSRAYTSYINQGGALLSSHESTLFTDEPMSSVSQLDASPVARFSTEPMNFNIAGVKQVTNVSLIGSFREAYVSVDWRNSKGFPFMSTPWRRCSPQGYCAPMVSGVDFRVNCMVPYADTYISAVAIEWQLSDKTSVRGAYVSPITAGAGRQ